MAKILSDGSGKVKNCCYLLKQLFPGYDSEAGQSE